MTSSRSGWARQHGDQVGGLEGRQPRLDGPGRVARGRRGADQDLLLLVGQGSVGRDLVEQQPALGEHQLDVDARGDLQSAACCQVATGSDQAFTSKVHGPPESGVTQAP